VLELHPNTVVCALGTPLISGFSQVLTAGSQSSMAIHLALYLKRIVAMISLGLDRLPRYALPWWIQDPTLFTIPFSVAFLRDPYERWVQGARNNRRRVRLRDLQNQSESKPPTLSFPIAFIASFGIVIAFMSVTYWRREGPNRQG
jgi:hypothetical protein